MVVQKLNSSEKPIKTTGTNSDLMNNSLRHELVMYKEKGVFQLF